MLAKVIDFFSFLFSLLLLLRFFIFLFFSASPHLLFSPTHSLTQSLTVTIYLLGTSNFPPLWWLTIMMMMIQSSILEKRGEWKQTTMRGKKASLSLKKSISYSFSILTWELLLFGWKNGEKSSIFYGKRNVPKYNVAKVYIGRLYIKRFRWVVVLLCSIIFFPWFFYPVYFFPVQNSTTIAVNILRNCSRSLVSQLWHTHATTITILLNGTPTHRQRKS